MNSGVSERASIPSLSECDPGLMPSEFNVLILPEKIEDKVGNIFIPETSKDAKEQAGQRGRLIAVSPVAFDYASFTEDQKPKPGDVVLFAKFAGTAVKGLDGRDYRVMKDRDIMAVEADRHVGMEAASKPRSIFEGMRASDRAGTAA